MEKALHFMALTLKLPPAPPPHDRHCPENQLASRGESRDSQKFVFLLNQL